MLVYQRVTDPWEPIGWLINRGVSMIEPPKKLVCLMIDGIDGIVWPLYFYQKDMI